MYIATGGEDSKVKVWNVSSGFCFVTFSKHIGPITGVKFIGKGTGLSFTSFSSCLSLLPSDVLSSPQAKQ
jgi:WD40 repeat protein